jgi:hypothetical protein
MRIIAVVTIVLLVIFAPYWLYIPAIVIGIVYFDYFVEGVALAFLVDLLYGQSFYHGPLFGFPFTLTALLLVLISIIVREKLRLYA